MPIKTGFMITCISTACAIKMATDPCITASSKAFQDTPQWSWFSMVS
jgi:hypothetical protein